MYPPNYQLETMVFIRKQEKLKVGVTQNRNTSDAWTLNIRMGEGGEGIHPTFLFQLRFNELPRDRGNAFVISRVR